MNILFCSVPFRPSVGGIETVSSLLAERFQQLGDSVVLVTETVHDVPDDDGFRIVRKPTASQLFSLVRWADVVFHNNISLRLAWPLLFMRRPWVVAHHTWIPPQGLAARVKRQVLRFAKNIAVSHAIAKSLPVQSIVVANPYDDSRFQLVDEFVRDGELVFLGRLVSDKGVHVLLDALGLLAKQGQRVCLTVIGEGPEESALREQAVALGIAQQVAFIGRRVGAELVWILNAHQVLVVPSVWQEPFGVVALEGMACGCVPLVTRSGGLPDAVGDCGMVVPLGDPQALAQGISELMGNAELQKKYRSLMDAHLERQTRDCVAKNYLQVIHDAYRKTSSQSTTLLV